MSESSCAVDRDCIRNYICMNSTSWFPTDDYVQPANSKFGCYCNPFYGWTYDEEQDKCIGTVDDPTYLFWHVISPFVIIVESALLLLLGHDVVKMKLNELLKKDAASTTTVFQFFACLFLFLQQILNLSNANVPNGQPVFATSSESADKIGEFGEPERIMVTFASCFTTLAAMNISLQWLEIAKRSVTMNPGRVENLKRYKKLLIGFQVTFFLLILISGPILARWGVTLFIIFPFCLFIMGSYILGSQKMAKALRSTTQSSSGTHVRDKYRGAVTRIQCTSLMIVCGMAPLIIFGAAFGWIQITNWREYTKPGELTLNGFLNEMLFVAMAWLHISVVYYIHPSVRARIVRVEQGNKSDQTSDKTSSHGKHLNSDAKGSSLEGRNAKPVSKPRSHLADQDEKLEGNSQMDASVSPDASFNALAASPESPTNNKGSVILSPSPMD